MKIGKRLRKSITGFMGACLLGFALMYALPMQGNAQEVESTAAESEAVTETVLDGVIDEVQGDIMLLDEAGTDQAVEQDAVVAEENAEGSNTVLFIIGGLMLIVIAVVVVVVASVAASTVAIDEV